MTPALFALLWKMLSVPQEVTERTTVFPFLCSPPRFLTPGPPNQISQFSPFMPDNFPRRTLVGTFLGPGQFFFLLFQIPPPPPPSLFPPSPNPLSAHQFPWPRGLLGLRGVVYRHCVQNPSGCYILGSFQALDFSFSPDTVNLLHPRGQSSLWKIPPLTVHPALR